MKKFIKFPEIEQFRNVIKGVQLSYRYKGKDENGDAIYDPSVMLPTLTFTGTCKIHGTHAAVSFDGTEIWAQARNHNVSVEHDNAGFAFFVKSNEDVFLKLFKQIDEDTKSLQDDIITIYGEWAGSNIQGGVAISGLEKMFLIFGVKITPMSAIEEESVFAYWLTDDQYKNIHSNENRIYNVHQFKTYSIDIDFNYPERSQNEIVKMTEEVEACCPVGKYFGKEGIGEGIVFCNYSNKTGRITFKSKGMKHSSSKVKKLAEVDTEKMNSINEFIAYTVTDSRLLQGIEYVFTQNSLEPDVKGTGAFLKWVVNDIIKEEMDTLQSNNLEPKDMTRDASTAARIWFMKYLNKQAGLK